MTTIVQSFIGVINQSVPGSKVNLGFLLQVIHDLNFLVEEVCGDYLGHVLELLKSCSPEVLDLVKQSILQGGKSLKDLLPQVISSIIVTVVERSVEVSYMFQQLFFFFGVHM